MLSEQQCKLIENSLANDVEPRKVAAFLCLWAGLALGEITALRFSDIDLDSGKITLCRAMSATGALTALESPRVLPLTPNALRYLKAHVGLYKSGDAFILTGDEELPSFHSMQNVLTSVAHKCRLCCTLSASDLRNAFVRRCIQSGMDLYSICAYIGIKQPNVIIKRFGEYFNPKLETVSLLEAFDEGGSQKNAEHMPFYGPKRMNLLILGAGSQGAVVKELAESLGMFEEIAFLDDDPKNLLAIGPLCELKRLADRFPVAIPSFGDSLLREKYMDILEQNGYIVPSLIHPSVTLSPSAKLGRSVVIEARCIVSSGASIGRGAILSGASVVEAAAQIGKFTHIGSTVTVAKNAVVGDYDSVSSGTVVRVE